MRKNTCILIRNWRKLLWNTEESAAHAKICKHRRWILRWQTLSVTSRAAAHPWVRVYVFQGEWELTHPGTRDPTPSQNYVLMPQALSSTAWKLAPLMLKPVGFQVLVSHSKVPSLPPGIQLHTALGFPSSHWWQTQSSSVGSHSETAAPGN